MDINLLKPSRIEFVHHPAPLLATSDTQASAPEWLEYIYRTAHPVLRWLPTKLAEWIGENLQDVLGFLTKQIRGQNLALAGLLQNSTIFFMSM